MASSLNEQFWHHSIWCPPGKTWEDFGKHTAQFGDLKYAVITASTLLLTRFCLEQVLFRPIGAHLCATQHARATVTARASTVKKFAECMWRFVFYSSVALYGWFLVLWDKPYRHDTLETLKDVHTHTVTDGEWWYYNIELAFYLSLIVSQFFDTKRKDFWQMFVHHIVTVLLIVFSWAAHYHRIGCLVMAIHDVADVPLEAAKLAKYCKRQKVADVLFGIFTVVWIYTRCYLLPRRVLYYTAYAGLQVAGMYPAYYIFNTLICALQILHFIWTYIIIKIAVDALQNDGMRDIRSDSEESHDD